jgi:hypothetical protein
MKSTAIASLIVALLASSRAGAQDRYVCGDGTIERVVAISQTASDSSSLATLRAVEPAGPKTTASSTTAYVVAVRLGDRVYVSQSPAGAPGNFDPASLTARERVAACASDHRLVIDRLDGTDYRAAVIRVDRGTDAADCPETDRQGSFALSTRASFSGRSSGSASFHAVMK